MKPSVLEHELNEGLADLELSVPSFTTTLPDRDTLSGWESSIRIVEILGRRVRFIIECEGEPPTWLFPSLQAMRDLLDLPEDWDSYGARTVNIGAVTSAIQLLTSIMRPETPAPAVVPTNLGGVQLEWHTRGIDLEIEIRPQARAHVCYQDHLRAVEREVEIASDLSLLNDCIAELSRRQP